ncbi:MAG: tail fiber protein, partial [Gallionella sp.]
VGNQSLFNNTTGFSNTAIGRTALTSNTTGAQNTGIGLQALMGNTTGNDNVATGAYSLQANTTGNFNVANGTFALSANTTGTANTAIGWNALSANTTNSYNTAVGYAALQANTNQNNTAVGYQALTANTTGTQNTAMGYRALASITTSINNIGIGNNAMPTVTTGTSNVGIGVNALVNSSTASFNTVVGNGVMSNNTTGGYNTAIGSSTGLTNTIGDLNIYLGYAADATVNNLTKAVAIGSYAKVSASNAIVLGGTGADAVNVGINTTAPAASARLDVVSTTSGFAMPRMTSVQRKAIVSPIDGLQVIDTDLKGIYIYFGGKWDCVSVPAGSTGYFANTTAPNGYLECNGQAVNRSIYAELFAAIGTVYGIGDGLSTFNVPDLRGEFVRGIDNGRGADPTRIIGTKQGGTLVTGDFDVATSVGAMSATSGTYQALYGADPFDASVYSATTTKGAYTPASSGIDTPSNLPGYFGATRPRNVAMLPCIKF